MLIRNRLDLASWQDGSGPATNALQSVHARVGKIIKTRRPFPTDEAATRLIWLALWNVTADWSKAAGHGRRP